MTAAASIIIMIIATEGGIHKRKEGGCNKREENRGDWTTEQPMGPPRVDETNRSLATRMDNKKAQQGAAGHKP